MRGKQAIGTLSVPCHADSRSQEPELALEVGDVTSQIPVCRLMEGLGFEAISQAKERKTQEVVDKGPQVPLQRVTGP